MDEDTSSEAAEYDLETAKREMPLIGPKWVSSILGWQEAYRQAGRPYGDSIAGFRQFIEHDPLLARNPDVRDDYLSGIDMLIAHRG